MKGSKRKREEVLRRMLRLADQRSNDSVRLAFLDEGASEDIGGMDLGALTEMKRHGNGAVEVKLINRVEILEKLFQMIGESGEDEIRTLLSAINEGDGAGGGEGD